MTGSKIPKGSLLPRMSSKISEPWSRVEDPTSEWFPSRSSPVPLRTTLPFSVPSDTKPIPLVSSIYHTHPSRAPEKEEGLDESGWERRFRRRSGRGTGGCRGGREGGEDVGGLLIDPEVTGSPDRKRRTKSVLGGDWNLS